jgi:hypothetical protein
MRNTSGLPLLALVGALVLGGITLASVMAGITLRGRTNVLRWIASQRDPPAQPVRCEFRDGQIYRWWTS